MKAVIDASGFAMQVTLITDDSPDSKRAVELIKSAGLDAEMVHAVADTVELPMLITPEGAFATLDLIRRYLRCSPAG